MTLITPNIIIILLQYSTNKAWNIQPPEESYKIHRTSSIRPNTQTNNNKQLSTNPSQLEETAPPSIFEWQGTSRLDNSISIPQSFYRPCQRQKENRADRKGNEKRKERRNSAIDIIIIIISK